MKAQLLKKVNTKIIQKLKRFVTLKKKSKIKNVFIQKLKSQVKSCKNWQKNWFKHSTKNGH